jgi:ribose/xylose/arabinose/galactoside ABC-type transport system permease subunit
MGADSLSHGRPATVQTIKKLFRQFGILIVFVLLLAALAIIAPNFMTLGNMLNILRQVTMIGIMSCGMTFVFAAGYVDLSVGSTLSLCGVAALTVTMNTGSMPLGVLTGLGIGVACGLLNGFLVNRLDAGLGTSFILTFGTMTIIASIALIVTGAHHVTNLQDEAYLFIGKAQIGVISFPLIIWVVTAVLLQFNLSKSSMGRSICAVGANTIAAKLSGVKVSKYRYIVFMISGGCAALAAIVYSARVGSCSPTAGEGYEMDAIAAVAIGGTSFAGGSGNVIKTMIGVLILGVLSNAMIIMNLTEFSKLIVKGCVVILAVYLDNLSRKQAEI